MCGTLTGSHSCPEVAVNDGDKERDVNEVKLIYDDENYEIRLERYFLCHVIG